MSRHRHPRLCCGLGTDSILFSLSLCRRLPISGCRARGKPEAGTGVPDAPGHGAPGGGTQGEAPEEPQVRDREVLQRGEVPRGQGPARGRYEREVCRGPLRFEHQGRPSLDLICNT